MKNLGTILAAGVMLASLSSCGKSEDANQPAVADTVEMPADELPSGDPSLAAPGADEADAMAPAEDGSGAPEAAADAAQSAAESAKAAASEAKAAKSAAGAKAPAGN